MSFGCQSSKGSPEPQLVQGPALLRNNIAKYPKLFKVGNSIKAKDLQGLRCQATQLLFGSIWCSVCKECITFASLTDAYICRNVLLVETISDVQSAAEWIDVAPLGTESHPASTVSGAARRRTVRLGSSILRAQELNVSDQQKGCHSESHDMNTINNWDQLSQDMLICVQSPGPAIEEGRCSQHDQRCCRPAPHVMAGLPIQAAPGWAVKGVLNLAEPIACVLMYLMSNSQINIKITLTSSNLKDCHLGVWHPHWGLPWLTTLNYESWVSPHPSLWLLVHVVTPVFKLLHWLNTWFPFWFASCVLICVLCARRKNSVARHEKHPEFFGSRLRHLAEGAAIATNVCHSCIPGPTPRPKLPEWPVHGPKMIVGTAGSPVKETLHASTQGSMLHVLRSPSGQHDAAAGAR